MTKPRRRLSAFSVVLTLFALLLVYLAVPNIGTVVRAARADGVPGSFTAKSLYCVQHPGHETCVWSGEFRSGDGTIRRPDVEMYGSDRTSHRMGEPAPAVDIGHGTRVYGPGGSNEWVFTALLLVSALVILWFLYGRPRRRRVPDPEPDRDAVPVD